MSTLDIGGSQLDTSWFLLLGAVLFTLGTVGVLVRRNPLVILICIELMLNAVNLTLITFSRQLQNLEGQLFALMVDDGRRGRGGGRARDPGRHLPRARRRGRRRPQRDEGMSTRQLALLILLLPRGRRDPARGPRLAPAAHRAPGSSARASCGPRSSSRWRLFFNKASGDFTYWTWIKSGSFEVPFNLLVDNLSIFMCLVITGVGGADRHVLGRLHGSTRTTRATRASSPTWTSSSSRCCCSSWPGTSCS